MDGDGQSKSNDSSCVKRLCSLSAVGDPAGLEEHKQAVSSGRDLFFRLRPKLDCVFQADAE